MAGGVNIVDKMPPLPWPIRNRYILEIGRTIRLMIIIAALNLLDPSASRCNYTD